MKVQNGLDLQNQKIINQADPTSAQDSATKAYVDSAYPGYVYVVPADVTGLNSTTLVEIPGMSHLISSSGVYSFRAELRYIATSGTSPSIQFAPGYANAFADSMSYSIVQQTATTGSSNVNVQANNNVANPLQPTSTLFTYACHISGSFRATSVGTFYIRYRAGGTSPVLTLRRFSLLQIQKLSAA